MSEPVSDRELVERWRHGDQQAAQVLLDRYVDRLVALSRRRISQRLAPRIDPEDVVQSVFRTFFHRAREGEFRIAEQDDLCKLLMRITVRKTLRKVAFHVADKRDPSQELGQGWDSHDPLQEVLAREPTSEEVVSFLDQMEHFYKKLRADERQILEMRLQGFSNDDIARKLNIYDRKIRRVFERIRSLAEQEGLGAV